MCRFWINGLLLPSPLNFHPHLLEVEVEGAYPAPIWLAELDECLTHPPLPRTLPPPTPTATPGPEPRLKSNLLRSQQQKMFN